MRRPLILVAALAATAVSAGVVYRPGPPPPPSTLTGPLDVHGSVNMTTGPMVVNGQFAAGPTVTLNTATLSGTTNVTGACTFSQPPTGLVRKGSLVRGASLGLAIGCQDLGTVAVAGSTMDSACNVTRRPTPILNLGITLDCFVATPGTVTVRACALLALLSAPSGTYGVTLVGE